MHVSEFYDLNKGNYDKTSFLNLLKEYNIETNKKFGQNFIWNLNLLQKFIDKSGIDENYKILEIGAGAGTLSYVLSNNANRVLSVEIDKNLEALLNDIAEQAKTDGKDLDFIFADANKLDWQEIYSVDNSDKLALVSNLPYNLTSTLIAKAIREFNQADKMLLLVEDNAAPRILGKAGDGKSENTNQGFLNKLISIYGNSKSLLKVSKNNFYPTPRINSELILLEANKESYSYKILRKYSQELHNLLKLAFSQRRKSLSNCLETHVPKEIVKAWVDRKNLKTNVRAEEISADDFAELLEFLISKGINLTNI